MQIMEAVRNFIRTYEPLAGNKINVDFLPETARSYSIDAVPCKEVIKTYLDGSSVRQFLFVLASREFYGEEIRQQLDNLGFYENFGAWAEKQSMTGNLPKLGGGKTPQKLETTTCGYAFAPGMKAARYQIQLRLQYLQEKGED